MIRSTEPLGEEEANSFLHEKTNQWFPEVRWLWWTVLSIKWSFTI